jgi:hypothetical protein
VEFTKRVPIANSSTDRGNKTNVAQYRKTLPIWNLASFRATDKDEIYFLSDERVSADTFEEEKEIDRFVC